LAETLSFLTSRDFTKNYEAVAAPIVPDFTSFWDFDWSMGLLWGVSIASRLGQLVHEARFLWTILELAIDDAAVVAAVPPLDASIWIDGFDLLNAVWCFWNTFTVLEGTACNFSISKSTGIASIKPHFTVGKRIDALFFILVFIFLWLILVLFVHFLFSLLFAILWPQSKTGHFCTAGHLALFDVATVAAIVPDFTIS
jgi:hypothetical protein